MSTNCLNIKSKVDGDELDLSMSRLTVIPVTEIASIPKATKIDLSNNEIVNIPLSFAECLTPVTKVDLSSNKLTELPKNFGTLVNLKHLDLYNNQLVDLPISLSSLTSLRYIDVKNNPLRPDLAKAAGDCLDNKECQVAAKNLISHLKRLRRVQDREFALQTVKEKELEMAKQRQEEEEKAKERERKKVEKKASKEKKRIEIRELQQPPASMSNSNEIVENGKQKKKEPEKKPQPNVREMKSAKVNSPAGKYSLLGVCNIVMLICLVLSAAICLVLYTDGDLSVEGVETAWPSLKRNSHVLLNATQGATESAWRIVGPLAFKVRGALMLGLGAFVNLSSTAIQALQPLTGDLSPYLEDMRHFWDAVVAYVIWVGQMVMELVSRITLEAVADGVRWLLWFLFDQIKVVYELFWGNATVLSLWKDAEPFRELVWTNTGTIRNVSWQFYNEVITHWVPVVQEHTYNIYQYGRASVQTLLTPTA